MALALCIRESISHSGTEVLPKTWEPLTSFCNWPAPDVIPNATPEGLTLYTDSAH